MSSKCPIWLNDPDLLTRFNHFKLDHGNKPDIALRELLDIAEQKKTGNS